MEKLNFIKLYLFIFLSIFFTDIKSQPKPANIWYFGDKAGLDFTNANENTPPTPIQGQMNMKEGVATICDENGELVFYTNGIQIYNKNHQVVVNDLKGHQSATQSGVVVPKPNTYNEYYIFTTDEIWETNDVYYSVLQVNNGNFVLTEKNILLHTNAMEKITAVLHSDRNSIWVIIHDNNSNGSFIAYLLTKDGLATTSSGSIKNVTSNINTPDLRAQGYMKSNPNGSKIVACGLHGKSYLLDFNNTTGKVTNPALLPWSYGGTSVGFYGAEFSPSSKYLFVGECNTSTRSLVRYEVANPNNKTIIAQNDINYGAFQLGPDGKIYHTNADDSYPTLRRNYISVIKNPDNQNCNYVKKYVTLSSGTYARYGLPNFVQSFFQFPEIMAENTCLNNPINFRLSFEDEIVSAEWDMGDGTKYNTLTVNHVYSSSGSYNVSVILNNGTINKTITKEITVYASPEINLGPDQTICPETNIVLDAGAGMASYQWHGIAEGQTTQTVSVDTDGLYWVTVENQAGCQAYDSIWVSYYPQTQVQISPNPAQICEGEQITLNASSNFADYKWQDGSTNSWFSTNIEQYVSVEAHDVNGCYSWDSLTVEVLPGINIDLGPDTLLCGDERYLIDAGYGQDYTYQWHGNSSETSRTIIAQQDGLYWVDVTNSSGCTGADSVYISHVPYPEFDLGPDTTICMQDTIEIGVEAETMSTYSWLPADSVDFPYLSRNLISPDDTTTYFLEVTRNWCTAVDSITINTIDCSCPYAFDNMVVNCNDLHDCDCDVPRICVPLKTVHPINDGIIGLDFCVEYDTRYLSPTGKVNIGEVVTNNGTYPEGIECDYYVNYILDPGKVHVSIYYQSPAPASAAFQYIENGTVACVEFLLKSDFDKDSTLEFTSCELRESYQLGVIDQCVEPGSFKLIDDTILEGNLIFWDDNNRPLRYDAANPANYRRTDISACGDSMVVSNPDLNGYFEYDITNGIDLEILRDIPGSYFEPCDDTSGDGECDVADKVNGFDCYRTGLVTTMNSSFFPSIYEILAMDVNQSGSVEAGDITQIQNRFLKETFEFPQVWNYSDDPQNPGAKSRDWVFVDELLLAQPEYKASAMYPLKGNEDEAGYSKYQLPIVPFCLTVDTIQKQFCTITPAMTYHAILLGDVNGDWDSDYSDGQSITLKSDSKESIVFDLDNASIMDDVLSIPVKYTGKDNLMSLDFIMESYDNSKLELIEIESNYQQEMQMAYNDNIRLISFSKVFGGISANQPVYNLKFKTFSNEISAEDLGRVKSYINGNKSNTIVTGAMQNNNSTIGVEKQQLEKFVVVAPNPSNGNFKISTNLEGSYRLKIINILGKIIYEKELTATENYINISSEPDGMYYIILTQNNKTFIEKLLID